MLDRTINSTKKSQPKFCTVHQEERTKHADRITGEGHQAQREILHGA